MTGAAQKIAVVGSGISGLTAAFRLRHHDLTVFEAGSYVGGHTNTVDVERPDGSTLAVDTGFIVFNERSYPNFCAMLREVDVAWQDSDMSFSVRHDRSGMEYNATDWNGLLAQRFNAVRPAFWRMLRDIVRFYREAPRLLETGEDPTLGEFLTEGRYCKPFIERHLLPMSSAIWSADSGDVRDYPMSFLARFFQNHGFMLIEGRPQWLSIRGGSREYVRALTASFRDRIRLNTPVADVRRVDGGVRVRTAAGDEEVFDRVILASHADQSLRMLSDASDTERELLSCFRYQRNDALLHTDTSVLPRTRRAWASWNYHVTRTPSELATVSYWMNLLQTLEGDTPYIVTLNRNEAVDPDKVLRTFVYHHPIYSRAAVDAQQRHGEIDGRGGVHFCGAYWGYGFHEDGVNSGLAVVRNVEQALSREPEALAT